MGGVGPRLEEDEERPVEDPGALLQLLQRVPEGLGIDELAQLLDVVKRVCCVWC